MKLDKKIVLAIRSEARKQLAESPSLPININLFTKPVASSPRILILYYLFVLFELT